MGKRVRITALVMIDALLIFAAYVLALIIRFDLQIPPKY